MGNIKLRALTQEDIKTTIGWNNKMILSFFIQAIPFLLTLKWERIGIKKY